MRKYYWTLFVMVLFSFGFAASDDDSDTDESFVGKYVVTDTEGTKWYFNFTSDKKVTVKTAVMSDDDMYYGTRGTDAGGYYQLDFHDFYAGNPPIAFPKFKTVWADYWYVTQDGWLYRGYDCIKSKNPKGRLKMIKQ